MSNNKDNSYFYNLKLCFVVKTIRQRQLGA